MTLSLPFESLYILYKMQAAGWQCYIVGGAVRDLIINSLKKIDSKPSAINHQSLTISHQPITDYDFATNATPEETQKVFAESYYENEFGMVGVAYDDLLAEMKKNGFELPEENLQTLLIASQQPKKKRIIDLKTAGKIHESLLEQENQDLSTKQKATAAINHQSLPIPHPFEITTYRSDGVYKDYRRPEKVTWGKTIEEDLDRRDFTINAMAIAIPQAKLKDIFKNSAKIAGNQKNRNSEFQIQDNDYQLIDLHSGMKNLADNLIRTVGDPDQRFSEDALRMLRAIRFAVQLNMSVAEETLQSIKANANLINHISWERISAEFLKMLTSDAPDVAIDVLDRSGLLSYILPELQTTKGVNQGGHHTTDVWTHSLDAVAACPSKDPIVRLATLLHDLGKVQTYKVINNQITAYGHDIVSSRIASKIAKRFKLSKHNIQRLFILVRFHMFYYQPHHTDAAIRRLMKRVGLENIDDILDLREGDRLGSGARKTSWRLEELKQRMIEQLHQPMNVRDLAINGHNLIDELGFKPGPEIGEVLKKLLEVVLDEPELNTKKKLLKKAKEVA